MNTQKLNLEKLNLEYIQWMLTNGPGRNEKDLRFGQYIHVTYDTTGFPDVFNLESAENAYKKLLEGIDGTRVETKG